MGQRLKIPGVAADGFIEFGAGTDLEMPTEEDPGVPCIPGVNESGCGNPGVIICQQFARDGKQARSPRGGAGGFDKEGAAARPEHIGFSTGHRSDEGFVVGVFDEWLALAKTIVIKTGVQALSLSELAATEGGEEVGENYFLRGQAVAGLLEFFGKAGRAKSGEKIDKYAGSQGHL